MSQSNSGTLISAVDEGSPIPELINLIKHTFRECEFNEIQKILIDRENKMKIEIENLTRLVEEKTVLQFESERLVAIYQHKLKRLDTKLVKMGQEIEDTRKEKLAVNKTVEELRRKHLEADKVVAQNMDGLMQKKLESDKAAELYKSQLEKLAPRIMKVEKELANMLKVEVDDLGNLVDALDKLAAAKEENVEFLDLKGEEKSLENGNRWKECIGLSKEGGKNLVRSSTKQECSNTVQRSPSSHPGCNPPQAQTNVTDQDNELNGTEGSDPLWSLSFIRGLAPSQDICAYTACTHASGTHSDGRVPVRRQAMCEAGCSSKMACSPSAAGDIIELSDSDDETNPSEAAYISDTGANAGANEMIFEKFVQSSSSSQTKKRNKIDCIDDSLINTSTRRKRSVWGKTRDNLPIDEKENQVNKSTHDRNGSVHNDLSVEPISDTGLPPSTLPCRCDENAVGACDSQALLQKFNGLIDEASTDSEDESCSDSHIEDLIATLKSKKPDRKWTLQADMLKAFQEDEELYMDAVWALYRQQIFTRKSSARALAEYLIDGDEEIRLSKSVSDVKQQRLEVLSQCQRLAAKYHEKQAI